MMEGVTGFRDVIDLFIKISKEIHNFNYRGFEKLIEDSMPFQKSVLTENDMKLFENIILELKGRLYYEEMP